MIKSEQGLLVPLVGNIGIHERNFREKWELCEHPEDTFIEVGPIEHYNKLFQFASDNFMDNSEIIISSIPVNKSGLDFENLNILFLKDPSGVHFPTNIISPSLIKLSYIKLHFSICNGCVCSLHEIIENYLNKGFRQRYIPQFSMSYDSNSTQIIQMNQVLNKYLKMIEILQDRIEVWIDGEMLTPGNTGTNTGALELICEIQKSPFVSNLVVILPESLAERCHQLDIRNIAHTNRKSLTSRTNHRSVLFRPNQSWRTSWLMPEWGHFNIHAQWWLDFISFDIPIYGGSWNGWIEIRNAALNAFEDYEVTFFLSNATERKFKSLTSKVLNHSFILPCSVNKLPNTYQLRIKKQLLVLGNSMHHKGRLFALELFKEISKLNNEYRLILAGPNPSFASSISEESKYLSENPELKSKISIRGQLTKEQVDKLIQESEAVLCPSISEGFGLVPFEAAAMGCVPFTSRIDFWADNLSPLAWIDFENLRESAKEIDRILELEDSKNKQIDSFMAFLNDNTWTDLANMAIGGFTKTLVAGSAIEIREQDSFRTRLRSQIVRIPWARGAYRRLLAVKNAF